MAVYLVTWNLNKEGAAYASASRKLYETLAKLTYMKDSGLDSVAFVSTASDTNALYNYLKSCFDSNDRFVVAKMNRNELNAFLDTAVGNWINSNI